MELQNTEKRSISAPSCYLFCAVPLSFYCFIVVSSISDAYDTFLYFFIYFILV